MTHRVVVPDKPKAASPEVVGFDVVIPAASKQPSMERVKQSMQWLSIKNKHVNGFWCNRGQRVCLQHADCTVLRVALGDPLR